MPAGEFAVMVQHATHSTRVVSSDPVFLTIKTLEGYINWKRTEKGTTMTCKQCRSVEYGRTCRVYKRRKQRTAKNEEEECAAVEGG